MNLHLAEAFVVGALLQTAEELTNAGHDGAGNAHSWPMLEGSLV
jgi:hypothetical protein